MTEERKGKFHIGMVIREHREARGLTQAQLCEGLCELSTMSKIENGRQQPSQAHLRDLLGRLGVIGDWYFGVRSYQELEVEDLKQNIKNANAKFEYKTALELLDRLEPMVDAKDHVNGQFVLWSRTINGRLADGEVVQYSLQEQLDGLNKAIRMTVPGFDPEAIYKSLLCLDEMIIMVNIANVYGEMEDYIKAIDLYRQIWQYAQNNLWAASDKSQIIPLIAYNYSKSLGQEKRSKEELAIAEIGIDCCIEYGKSRLLGELYINKACALHRLGREPEGKHAMLCGYHFLAAMERWEDVEIVKKHFKETYNFDIV